MALTLDIPFSTVEAASPTNFNPDTKSASTSSLSPPVLVSTPPTEPDSAPSPEGPADAEYQHGPRIYFPPPPPDPKSRRKPYPCNVPTCSRSYMTLRNLQLHQNYHPTSFLCRYDNCAGAFVSLIDRTVHEVNYHGKSTLLQCYLCPYSSQNRESTRGHIKRQHPEVDIQAAMSWVMHGEGPGSDKEMRGKISKPRDKSLWLVCHMCGMKTERESNMYQHLWRNHKDEKTSRMVLLEKMKIEREERVKQAEGNPNMKTRMEGEIGGNEKFVKVKVEEELDIIMTTIQDPLSFSCT